MPKAAAAPVFPVPTIYKPSYKCSDPGILAKSAAVASTTLKFLNKISKTFIFLI